MNLLRKIAADFVGLVPVCGLPTALRWLIMIGRTARACWRGRSLHPADVAMGTGPFRVRRRGGGGTNPAR